MATTIVPSDLAPDEAVHYSFAGVEFDLDAGGSYETDDREVITNADAHPWLTVEVDPEDIIEPRLREPSVRPEDDPLSAVGPNAGVAFDPAEIAKVEDAKAEANATVAIDAGLDQGEAESVGNVATTLAAAPESSDEAPAPAAPKPVERPIFSTPSTDEDTN